MGRCVHGKCFTSIVIEIKMVRKYRDDVLIVFLYGRTGSTSNYAAHWAQYTDTDTYTASRTITYGEENTTDPPKWLKYIAFLTYCLASVESGIRKHTHTHRHTTYYIRPPSLLFCISPYRIVGTTLYVSDVSIWPTAQRTMTQIYTTHHGKESTSIYHPRIPCKNWRCRSHENIKSKTPHLKIESIHEFCHHTGGWSQPKPGGERGKITITIKNREKKMRKTDYKN